MCKRNRSPLKRFVIYSIGQCGAQRNRGQLTQGRPLRAAGRAITASPSHRIIATASETHRACGRRLQPCRRVEHRSAGSVAASAAATEKFKVQGFERRKPVHYPNSSLSLARQLSPAADKPSLDRRNNAGSALLAKWLGPFDLDGPADRIAQGSAASEKYLPIAGQSEPDAE
jgi:hypothetical protein